MCRVRLQLLLLITSCQNHLQYFNTVVLDDDKYAHAERWKKGFRMDMEYLIGTR